ncbi:MAG: tetratricopeptide repeat protein [Solirubrobacteraceae bacterium]
MATRGWLAGLWRPDRSADRVPIPRLIVIDYAEAAGPKALDEMLDDLRRGASEISPVRVLLLTRTRTSRAGDPLDALRELATATLQSVMDAAENSDAAESSFGDAQRQSLYREAVASFIAAWKDDAADEEVRPTGDYEPDLKDDRFGLPLEVLYLAHDRAIGPQPADAALPPADRVLAHEERYWQRTAPADVGHELLRRCVALSTLAGAASKEEAHALLATLSALASQPQMRETIIGWLSDLYDGPGVLNPLRPDRLGEALIAKLLRGEDDRGRALLDAVAGLPSDDQLVRALDVLTRLSATDELSAAAMAQMLARHHIRLVLRAEAQARGTRDRPGRLDLANAIARPLAGQLASAVAEALAAAEPGNTTYQRDVSVSYNTLGDLARASGQAVEAERLYRQSLTVREALAAAEPGNTTYQRDVSVSYDRLGDLARASGQAVEAERLYRQSLTVAEALAAAEPGNTTYQRDVSVSYNKLGDLAVESGQAAEAERLYRQSLTVREALAAAEPGNTTYQRDVSVSYNKLGDLARASGQAAEAVKLLEAAVKTRRALGVQEPGRLDLAEELAVALYLFTQAEPGAIRDCQLEMIALLTPFEHAGALTPKGAGVLAWARR